MSAHRTQYNQLSNSDLEVDCAEVYPEGRVPYLGLYNTPGECHKKHHPCSAEDRSTDLRPHDKLQRQDSNYDSGLDDGIFSIEEKIESLHMSEELPAEKSVSTPTGPIESVDCKIKDSVSLDENYFSGPQNLNGLAELYEQDEDGDTMLHLAIIQPMAEQIEKLIHLCPSPDCLNIQNHLQQTPLHLAVLTRQPYVVRNLINKGAQLETRDRNGNTALHLACKMGDNACVQALTFPITDTEKECVTYYVPLQNMPQNMNLKNYDGETCLHLAAGAGKIDLVHFLIHECHADVNSQEGKSGRTILHQAVEANNYQLVSYLLKHTRLNIEACTYDMSTPLKLAYGRRFSSVMSLLMNAGADSSQLSGDDSGTDSDDEMMDSSCNDNMME